MGGSHISFCKAILWSAILSVPFVQRCQLVPALPLSLSPHAVFKGVGPNSIPYLPPSSLSSLLIWTIPMSPMPQYLGQRLAHTSLLNDVIHYWLCPKGLAWHLSVSRSFILKDSYKICANICSCDVDSYLGQATRLTTTLAGHEGQNVYIPLEYISEILPFIASLDMSDHNTSLLWTTFFSSAFVAACLLSLVSFGDAAKNTL